MQDVIRLAGVRRSFHLGQSEVEALRQLDLTIRHGEFIALAGPSGSGKSTLLNLLGGLDHPSDGEIWVNELALHTASEQELTAHRRNRVGFIFQTFNLLPRLTALENVALPLMLAGVERAEREQRAQVSLERVGLSHRLDHLPLEMSGGEQQRAAIARALVHSPDLVLADEPTGNLDSKTGTEVMRLLRELNHEHSVTLVVVTHDPKVAAHADRIVRLEDGQIRDIESLQTKDGGTGASSSKSKKDSIQSGGGLAARDLLSTAFENLGRRPVRNMLTSAGVLIGIVTLVAMVSFGVGVQKEIRRNFESLGLENVIIQPVFAETDSLDPFGLPRPENPLTPEVAAQLAALPEVLTVTPNLDLPRSLEISLTLAGEAFPVRVVDSFGEHSFGPPGTNELLAGSGLGEGETEGVVLVSGLADQLLEGDEPYEDLIGQTIVLNVRLPRGEINEFEATIVGVRSGFGTRSLDLGIAERAAIKAWWFGRSDTLATDGYDLLVVRARDLSDVSAVVDAAEDLGLEAQTLGAFLELANQVLAILQALLGSVGALALLVATLGVANTMMMAIYERTREIGVLKALGASRAEVRRMFVFEAAMIGLIGGALGVILGTLLGRLVDWIAHQYLASEGVTGVGQLSVVPLWLSIGALVFAAAIGIIGGLYPAARAASLDPVEALRYE